MNIRPYLFASVLLAANTNPLTSAAQDETDALRYSNIAPQGTARSMGIGGAVGALGGDFTSLSVNPAGIGVYRKSEFTFTPSIKINGSSSSYQGINGSNTLNTATQTDDNASRFTINNMGVVFTSAAQGQRYERSKWKSVSFGFGINRIGDYNQNYSYSGTNNIKYGSSGAEVFSIDANSQNTTGLRINSKGDLGYQSYLLDYDSTKGYTPVTWNTSDVNQKRVVSQKGGMTDIAISLGGNYMEKLMLGATLGIPSVVYKRDFTYTETDANNNPSNHFASFDYNESLVTRGTGLNLKLGFIYKPVDAVRIGAAFHTPTYFSLKDVQDVSLKTNTENYKADLGGNDINPLTTIVAPQNVYEYNLWTPWRAVGSVAGIIGKYGFISGDVEYVDYSSARYRLPVADRTYQSEVNQNIKSAYKGAMNARIGVEGRLDFISIRLGFAYYGNPNKNTAADGNAERMNLTGGIGFRNDNWYLDLGFAHTISKDQEHPYNINYANPVFVPTAVITNSLNNAALTFGVRF